MSIIIASYVECDDVLNIRSIGKTVTLSDNIKSNSLKKLIVSSQLKLGNSNMLTHFIFQNTMPYHNEREINQKNGTIILIKKYLEKGKKRISQYLLEIYNWILNVLSEFRFGPAISCYTRVTETYKFYIDHIFKRYQVKCLSWLSR